MNTKHKIFRLTTIFLLLHVQLAVFSQAGHILYSVTQDPPFVVSANATETVICAGQQITLTGSGATSYTWSGGVQNGVAFSLAVTTIYTVTGYGASNCTDSDTIIVYVSDVFQNEQICLVTVDTITWKNMIMWEKTAGVATASFNIYKETSYNIYDSIGNVPYDSLSYFIDYFSVPESHGDKYKISVIDTCSNESLKSPYHKTMNLGLSNFGSTMYLDWDDYVDESGLYHPAKYYIYRGASPDNMQLLDSISGSFTSYNDLNIFDVYYYMIGVKKYPPCNINGTGDAFSNKKDNSTLVNINSNDLQAGTILIAPNPMTNATTLTIPNFNISKTSEPLQIMDITGKIVMSISISNIKFDSSKTEIVIERGDLTQGVYFVELKAVRTYRGKLIIE